MISKSARSQPDYNPETRFAAFLTGALSPWIAGPVTFWLTAYAGTRDSLSATLWAVLITTQILLPLFIYIVRQVRSGRMTDIHVGVRQQRRIIYLSAIGLLLVAIAFVVMTGAPATLLPLLVSMLLVTLVNASINRHWKISLHATSFAGSMVVLLILYGESTLFATLPLLLLVSWSRVALGEHDAGQVIAGALVSGTVTASVFGILLS